MAITLVQSKSKNYGASLSLEFSNNNTSGNSILVGANVGYATGVSISDTMGNSYSLIQTTTDAGSNTYTALWFCPTCTSGSNTITLSGTGLTNGSCAFAAMEISGINASDQLTSTRLSGSNPTWSNSVTTTETYEIVVGCISNGYGGLSLSSPFSSIASYNYFLMGYNILTSAQVSTMSGTKNISGMDSCSIVMGSFYSNTAPVSQVTVVATDPVSAENGSLWYNSTSNVLKCSINGVNKTLAIID